MQNPEDVTRTRGGVTPPAAPVSLAGQVLKDRYQIERELGRGGFGIVYLALDLQLVSKPVVVKVLTIDASQDPWVMKKFNQEMEALARINHPAVIGALDAGQTSDGKPFLVMQYVDGGSLRVELDQAPLSLERAASIVRQTGQALSAAHEKGIYHRDIKPENILLQRAGDDEEYVKLIDFGIASIKDSLFSESGGATKVAGSYSYMAPEQFKNKPCAQSDVYGLALVAYEMVTGKKAFPESALYNLMMQQQNGPAIPATQLRPDLPAAAEQSLLKALSADPAHRHATPREFGEDFYRACQGTRVQAVMAPESVRLDAPPVKPQAAPISASGLEVAHVLFLDIVGYSTLAMDEQTKYLDDLQQVVRSTSAFQSAEKAGNLIRLPTGDGMALSFFGDPVAPVECAVQVGRQLKGRPHLRLRAGVNSGPVYRVADINANNNVAGGGINMAQRVMDCGDAGHILVSSNVAETLLQLSAWRTSLTRLGEVTVKHGVTVHVYNLCTADAGNPELPKKVAAKKIPEPSRRGLLALAGIVIAAAVAGGAWYWNSQPGAPAANAIQRTLRYSITLQKYTGGQPDGKPFQLPGEMIFTPEHRIALNISSPEAGHLYVLNLGPLTESTECFNVLYPPLVTGASSGIGAGQTVRFPSGEHWLQFDKQQGTEKLYLVWAAEPVETLEQAASGKTGEKVNDVVVIKEPAQVAALLKLLEGMGESKILEKDVVNKQTVLRSPGKALAHLVLLEHH
ncbi:MAG: protein kinase [Acidobacteriia bacterium]|nr:protein kinase [Terriglobia bacterium]